MIRKIDPLNALVWLIAIPLMLAVECYGMLWTFRTIVHALPLAHP